MLTARAAGIGWLLASAAAAAAGEDPAQLMTQFETRLLAARSVTVEATVESSGAISSSLSGRTQLQDRNRASLDYSGQFRGKPVELTLKSDGRTLELRKGREVRQESVARETNRALLIGLARMGLVHNLSRLAVLQAPERAAAGIERWVTLDSFRPTTFAQDGELQGMMAFGFDVVVGGETSASVRLWLDPTTGLPRRRQVFARSPQGETEVIEDYRRFVLE